MKNIKRKKKLKQFFVTEGISKDFYNEDGERFLDEVVKLKKNEFISKVCEKCKLPFYLLLLL